MTRRAALSVTAGLLAAAGVLPTGAPAHTSTAFGLRSCGRITTAGKQWQVNASGVPCADAKALVRALAPKAVLGGTHPAMKYQSLNCIAGKKQGKAGIYCTGSQGRKLVIAIAL